MQRGDETLVEAIRCGSRDAFAELMKRHQRIVYRVAWSYTRRDESALDLSQDIFLKAWRYLPGFEGRGSFASWLLRIAHREGQNWRRSQAKHEGHAEIAPETEPAAPPTQEDELQRSEERRLLWSELDRLNRKQRLAVSMRHFDQLPISEIAAALECSEGVARNILFRGIEKLRRSLALRRRWNHEGLRALSASDRKIRRG